MDSAIQHLNNHGQDVLIFLHLHVHVYASVALREKILMLMLILVWTKVSKSHAYDKSDSSWGFVKIENEQIKTVHVLVDKTGMKLLIFIGEKVNNKQQVKGRLGHMVQLHLCHWL